MYRTILLATALQPWDRYGAHALASREVAATLAKGATHHLHVLSVYDFHFKAPASGLPQEMVAQLHEEELRRTNNLMERKIDEYIAPLKAGGLEVTPLLRIGNPRRVIMQTASELKADLLVIGSHSKRGLFSVARGGTAKHLSQHASCPVVLVSPEKQT
ncbi:MAG TPA: universal stress protein [Candidatus Tectomicrobia bacterium]|jgi:nucleotide-binding universal stress UspA family protein